jgi:hypothetical protein
VIAVPKGIVEIGIDVLEIVVEGGRLGMEGIVNYQIHESTSLPLKVPLAPVYAQADDDDNNQIYELPHVPC